MSGRLRGNWRGTKTGYMIGYWCGEPEEGLRVAPALPCAGPRRR